MPAVAYDHLQTVSISEKLGVIRSMTRLARVTFTDAELATIASFKITKLALKACDTNVPSLAVWTTLADEGYKSLVLVDRDAKLVDQDPRAVDVELKYEHVLDGPNQPLFNAATTTVAPNSPIGGLLYGKGRCSIVEKTTNSYYPFGKPDSNKEDNGRVQILVAHTYPPGDMGIVGQALLPGLPFTVVQSGEVTLPFPQENFQIMGVMITDNPRGIATKFVAKINANAWLGKPALSWICSDVQWDVVDTTGNTGTGNRPTYRFTLEFQYNIDTWDATVVFKDQRTGRPPFNVEKADSNYLDANGVKCLVKNPYVVSPPAATAIGAIVGPIAGGLAKVTTGINAPVTSLAAVGAIVGPPITSLLAGSLQPAGVWSVPALERVDFNQLLGATFEGQDPAEIS